MSSFDEISFNLDEFKKSLEPFGTLNYANIYNEGAEKENLEFAVNDVNFLYCVTNFGEFTKNQILPYYPKLMVLSMDKIRLKGSFMKN